MECCAILFRGEEKGQNPGRGGTALGQHCGMELLLCRLVPTPFVGGGSRGHCIQRPALHVPGDGYFTPFATAIPGLSVRQNACSLPNHDVADVVHRYFPILPYFNYQWKTLLFRRSEIFLL